LRLKTSKIGSFFRAFLQTGLSHQFLIARVVSHAFEFGRVTHIYHPAVASFKSRLERIEAFFLFAAPYMNRKSLAAGAVFGRAPALPFGALAFNIYHQ